MRTRLYKFIFIVISLCALATTNAWANKIVYLDVTDAPFHSNLEYTTDMYIYYWVPGSDTKKYYQLVPKDSYQTVNGRMVYRIVLGNNANTSDEWWWRVCRKNTDGSYYHNHKNIRYNQYNWYRIQNEMWVYDESNDPGTSSQHKDGIAYRTPGLLTGGHIYFDNARTKWTGVIQFVVGHGSEMHTYTLTKINDTELYYLNLTEALETRGDSWGISHTYYSFIANTSAWANTLSLHPEGVNNSDVGFSENYRRQGELLDGKVYFIRPKKESGNWLFDIYQTVPKYTIYQRAMIRPTGGSYAAVENGVNYPASVNISLIDTIYGSTQETVSKTYNSGTNKNYNPRVLIAGKIVHTYKSLNSAAYTFDGWGSEPSTTGVPTLAAPSNTKTEHTHYISENTTVCAFFTAKQFTVTLDNQDATTAGTTSVTPSYGYVMPTITIPSRTGYTFGGYYLNTGGQGTRYYKNDGTAHDSKKWDQTANTTLYAKWTANKYTVKFNGNGHTSGSMSDQSFTYDVAQNLTANAFSRTGYTFAGWNTNAAATGTSYADQQSVSNLKSNNNGEITLYAQWTANQYNITLNANGGSGNTASVQATYASATLPEITNPTRTGYTFKGWYSASNGGTLVINTNGQLQASISGFTDANKKWIATADKTLYAQWTANTNTPYVVKHYQQNLDGTYPSTPTNTDNLTGTTAASITPSVKSYQGFSAPSKQTTTIAANGSTVVEYRYTRNSYELTWNLAGGTISNAGTAAGAVKFGATLTAPTVTRTGYTFKSWSPVPSTMPANDATYTAQWTCVAPTNVHISGNYIVFPGETIELTVSGNNIAADATYVWKKGDQVIPGQTTATLTIPNCVAANAGNYSCTVTNGTCSASSNDFTIKIYRLRGLTDSGWTTDFVFTKAEGNTAVLYLDLVENTYEFKLNDGTDWYWNEGTMTYDNCTNWVIEQQGVDTQGKTNTKLSTSISGLYIFTLDYTDASKPKLSVTYPSKKVVYLNPNIWGNNAKYTIYSWNSNGGNGIFTPMEIADCEGNVYKAEIDAAHNWVSFIRAEKYANGWDGLWNRSKDLMLVANPQFKITNWENEGTEGFQAAEKWTEKSDGEWEPYIPYYTISYDMNTNEVEPMENVCLQDGSAWTAPTDPERIGYTFLGWRRPANTNDDTLYKEGQSFTPKADEQLTAQWQLDEFTVTWKVGGSDYATNVVSVRDPLMENTPQNPADDALGCCADKFMGWSTSANPNESDVFDAKVHDELPSITQNTTFHAVFATKAPGVGSSSVTFRDMGYEDKQTVESITLGDGQGSGDATITLYRGASLRNDPKYYTIGNALRAYAGNTITIASTYGGAIIKNVTFTFGDGDGTNKIKVGEEEITNSWTGDANTVTFTISGSTGHRRIASISVTTGINGNEYTNYLTQCPNLGVPTLGEPTIDKTSIDVRCNTISSMKSAAKITFPNAADLTCPITVTASDGFLISTDQNASAKYASSLTIYPKKSDPNKGTIAKTVYVRADATQQTEPYSGTITILKTEGDEETKSISITANVNCQSYVLNTVDHLGSIISTTENFANDIIANAPKAPEPDPCSTSYTFAGWSMTEVAYGSPSFTPVTFPFVMPAEDVTLYPVYICNSDYHRVTSDLGANNWAGDYLIAYSDQIFADGSTNDLGQIAENNLPTIENNIISARWGDLYKIAIIYVEGGYVLKTQDNNKPYVYINASGTQTAQTANQTTADDHPLTLTYEEPNVKIINQANKNGYSFQYYPSGSCFGFYKSGQPIYLYKKYLYTSSLICEEITAEDAMVTSTEGQTIKVNVTATMSNMTVDRERALTVDSDNSDFAATIVPTTNANEYNVAVSYTPSAEDNTDGKETATITIKVNKNPVTTFQVTGRHLPANFVIAAKWGENWYALPANIDSESSKEGLLIEVDNPADPTKAIAAPNNTQYSLKSVKSGNFDSQGERLVFVGSAGKTLYNAEGTSIQVYAQYENYDDDRYEWIPTTDLKDYTLTSAHVYTDEEPRTISLDNYGVFGTLLQNKSYNGQVRLLPVDNFYEPAVLKVVEWKTNSVSIMYAGEATKVTTKVSDNTESDVQLLSDKNIDHVVYNLSTYDLTTATNKPLIITLQDNEGNTVAATTLTIPAIVTGEKNTTSLVASNDIAKATSVVILDGATLTADATKYTYDDIVVYPGGKLVINNGGQLGMYTLTLRAGSSWGAKEYEHKYPQFVLNTTATGAYSNTSAKINYDYVTTKEQYYTFVSPFAVNTKTIKYPVDIYGSNVAPDNTGSFEFQYYDGAARAEGNTGWTVVQEDPTNGAILTPGKGYTFLGMPKKINGTRQTYGIHRIPMSISASDAMLHETREQTVNIAAHPAIKNNNSGWNLIGNPYMQLVNGLDNDAIQVGNLVKIMNANGTWTGGWHWDDEDPVTAERYLVFPSNDGLSYTAVQTQNAELPAFKNFFVQINNEAGTEMTIPNPNQQVQPALQAPAYHDGEALETDVEVAMVLEQDEKHTDQLDLLINKAYTADFDRDADFTKMMNATQFNLFGVHWDNLSFIAIDQQTAQQSIPIGYQVPDAGEYTLRMSDKPYLMWDKIEALYLTDHEMEPEVTTDIMQQPYLFHVGKAETNHTRFTLSIIRKAESENQTPTHIDTQVAERKWSCKFIYQNKIYILHDGVIYDMMGKQIRTINK